MKIKVFSYVICTLWLACSIGNALSNSANRAAFVDRYNSATEDASCHVCHDVRNPVSAPTDANPYGFRLRGIGSATPIATRLANIESEDSDNQGDSNLNEILSGTQPGWINGAFGAPAVPLDPQNPIAEANGPYPVGGGTNLAISFDSSGSSDPDPDGSIVSYNWNFGDGTTSTAANPNHTYAGPGSYSATLTVTDNIGATGSDTASVNIMAPPQDPVAEANGPYAGTDLTVTFSAAGSNDPDGTIVQYHWDFGDNNTVSSPNIDVSHTYSTYGSYVVTLTVTDNSGATASDTASVTITTPQDPIAEANGPYIGTDLTVMFSAAGSSDPDGNIVKYSWNFGSSGVVGPSPNVSHTYSNYGSYVVTLTVTDNSGATASDTASVTITEPQDPIAEANGPYIGTDLTVMFSAAGSSDPDGNIVQYSWNFGSSGVVGPSPNVSHTYSDYGSYVVTLTVTDNSGATATDTASVTITEPIPAKVLLVDNDDNSPDTISYYTKPLDGVGITYDLWDVSSAGEPDAAALADYQNVVWFTGDNVTDAGPSDVGEAALAAYLDNGGNLFISSQDYHFQRGLTSFMQTYLGVQSVTNDVLQTDITGVGLYKDTIVDNSPLTYPFSNFSDIVQPNSSASTVFTGNLGNLGLLKRSPIYSAMFWVFPFEALNLGDRTTQIRNFLGNSPLRNVLLVDDDNNISNDPNVLSVYQNTLNSLGYSHSVWDKKMMNSGPGVATLRQFKDVIWFTAFSESFGNVGPSTQEEQQLTIYLEEGGKLLLSSQDYSLGRSSVDLSFFKKTFGIDSVQQDKSYVAGLGKGEFTGVGAFDIDVPFGNYTDEVTPDGTSDVIIESALSDTAGPAGVLKRTDKYLAVYLGFPFEDIVDSTDKVNLMRAYLNAKIDNQFCFPIVSKVGIVVICL